MGNEQPSLGYRILGALFMRNKGNGAPEISNHKVFGTVLLGVNVGLMIAGHDVPDLSWYTVWGFLGVTAVKTAAASFGSRPR